MSSVATIDAAIPTPSDMDHVTAAPKEPNNGFLGGDGDGDGASAADQKTYTYTIGIDEAGRGPLFGRVYAAAVILPADFVAPHPLIKDSKKFHSKKKIAAAAEFVKETAVAWAVAFEEPAVIDEINIRRATFRAMHAAVREVLGSLPSASAGSGAGADNTILRVDGNDFVPYVYFDTAAGRLREIPHETVIGGDDLWPAISAASILAKVSRDAYIEDLCAADATLSERYAIDKNMGYGTKAHVDGIRQWGLTAHHRRSFSIKGWSACGEN